MDYWNHVLWSEENKYLFGSDGVKCVWRQPGEEYKDKCILPTVKHGGGSVMVRGCMSASGTGKLQLIEGTVNANMYCDILKQSMIPSLRRLGRRVVFQHDNDHCLAKDLLKYISVCYGNGSNQDCKALQRVVRLAERISVSVLPSLQDIYLKHCKSRAVKIIKDSNHSGNRLFILLPSDKRFRRMMAKTERLRRSFSLRPSGS